MRLCITKGDNLTVDIYDIPVYYYVNSIQRGCLPVLYGVLHLLGIPNKVLIQGTLDISNFLYLELQLHLLYPLKVQT